MVYKRLPIKQTFYEHQNATTEELRGMRTDILQYIDDIMSVPPIFEVNAFVCMCLTRVKKKKQRKSRIQRERRKGTEEKIYHTRSERI